MLNFGIGFAACALLCAAFPKVAAVVNDKAKRLIAWGAKLWKGNTP